MKEQHLSLDQTADTYLPRGVDHLVPYEKYCYQNGHKLTYCQFAALQEQG